MHKWPWINHLILCVLVFLMGSGRALFPESYLIHCPLIYGAANCITSSSSLVFHHERDISKNYAINTLSVLISLKPLFKDSVAMCQYNPSSL